jgi:hypothetical protein
MPGEGQHRGGFLSARVNGAVVPVTDSGKAHGSYTGGSRLLLPLLPLLINPTSRRSLQRGLSAPIPFCPLRAGGSRLIFVRFALGNRNSVFRFCLPPLTAKFHEKFHAPPPTHTHDPSTGPHTELPIRKKPGAPPVALSRVMLPLHRGASFTYSLRMAPPHAHPARPAPPGRGPHAHKTLRFMRPTHTPTRHMDKETSTGEGQKDKWIDGY